MGCRSLLGVCFSLIWVIAIIASAVLGILFASNTFGLWNAVDTLTEDPGIQLCIALVADSVDIEPPYDEEYQVLEYCCWALLICIGLICCLSAFLQKSDMLPLCVGCAGCLMLIAACGAASFAMHNAIYVFYIDRELSDFCREYEEWRNVYMWSLGTGSASAASIVFWFGACCLLMGDSGDSSSDTSYNDRYDNNSHDDGGRTSNVRTVAVMNNQRQVARNDDGVELTGGQKEALARLLISAEVIEQCGFSLASEVNMVVLLALLRAVDPSGQTALRDAIALGVVKMLRLKMVLAKLGVVDHKFIHIVLTDGEDNSSECSVADLRNLYRQIGEELGDRFFKTFFIGIDLEYSAKQQLQSVADCAGDSAELFNCSEVQISDVFERIKLSLGIERRVAFATDGTNFVAAEQKRLYLQAEKQQFLVLFDLDMSGSMGGPRWSTLQNALASFFANLDDKDIIGCVLFNHQAVCVTGEALNKATR